MGAVVSAIITTFNTFNIKKYLTNLCQRRHSLLAQYWDNVHLTAKITPLFVQI